VTHATTRQSKAALAKTHWWEGSGVGAAELADEPPLD
jgi:hypothetical protein